MRRALLYNPRLLCERLAIASIRARRLAHLRNTPAAGLKLGHIDSLELLKIARDADVHFIYDIGANVGTWSLLAKAIMPEADIHAFEPLAEHISAFQVGLDRIAGVTIHDVALGSEEVETVMHVTGFSDASSILPPNEAARADPFLREVRQQPMRLRRLDDFRQENNLPWPDLIKLDVQGYEVEVLRGASECLATARAVIAEVSFVPSYDGQCLFHEIVAHLAQAGLMLSAFSATTPVGRPVAQTDVLFVRDRTIARSSNG